MGASVRRSRFAAALFATATMALLILPLFDRSPDLVGVNGPVPAGVRLQYPPSYDLLAPFTVTADRLELLSPRQWAALFVWLLALTMARLLRRRLPWRREGGAPRTGRQGRRSWRGRRTILLIGSIASMIAWTAWWGRPMAALRIDDPDLLAVDFHSHTAFSKDARRSFLAPDNMEWHRLAGFDASFITDHHSIEGALAGQRWAGSSPTGEGSTGQRSTRPSPTGPGSTGTDVSSGARLSLTGAELRFSGLHVVELGCPQPEDPADPRGSEAGPALIARLHRCGGAVIAALPEYRLLRPDPGLERLADWGFDGFEILTDAPRGLALPAGATDEVVRLCRARRLAAVAVTDSHGYGSAPAGWSVMRIAGWRSMDGPALERAIVRALRQDGPEAVRVVARRRLEAASLPGLALDPWRQALAALRGLTRSQTLACLAWLWVPVGLHRLARRSSGRRVVG